MTVDLSQFESGHRYAGDYAADLRAIQQRLGRIQASYILHGGRAIIVIEGWGASGKGGAIRRLVASWDPRWFHVCPTSDVGEDDMGRHFLWRFWQCVPSRGHINVFDQSWYRRVLAERVDGRCSQTEWQRAFDEINEFECQQCESGTKLIKIFLHVTAEEQDKRLKARLEDPWKRWQVQPEDLRNRLRRQDYLNACSDMFLHCNTRWAPWIVLDANHKKTLRINVLRMVADQLEQAINMSPPALNDALIREAEMAFGQAYGGLNQG